MRLKLLLFSMLISAGVFAQNDTIQGLLITEARLNNGARGFFEITNLGDEPVNLSQIEFAEMRPWGEPPWEPPTDRRFFLPDFVLQPDSVFVVSGATDYGPKKFAEGLQTHGEKGTNDDMWDIADFFVHVEEAPTGPGDSIWEPGTNLFTDLWGGRSCIFIRQHWNRGDTTAADSVVLDQVNGWFDGDNGLNFNGSYDVAGVSDASADAVLIRKYAYKEGNLDFANAAGIGEDDGEWIAIPYEYGVWRSLFWTLGNHGAYNLDENTLESDMADIDFANKVITVPWGTRRADGVMKIMKKKPGIAWIYHVSPVYEDSIYHAAKTGDMLEVFVCGDDLDKAMFDIVVAEPTADANIVVPVSNLDPDGNYMDDNEDGILAWPRVTEHGDNDTIWGSRGGVPFATRVDTLLERLEKPANATWEIEWVDGMKRADVKNGDKLVVTAQDGSKKSYYISVNQYRESINALLSAITWPDIPDFYRGIFGWIGDTIPGFAPTVLNYRVSVPLDVDGIPALVAKKSDLNSTVEVTRAASLSGTLEQRTISFTVTAEDDTTVNVYNVELVKEKNPVNVQPWEGEPFLSELVFWDQWSNSFGEIANPGNQPLDLSDYMIAMQWNTDPAGVIASRMGTDEWLDRYDKYVPGYKWVSEAQWAVTPGILEQDLNVNPIVMPGDVFVFAGIWTTSFCAGPFWWDANYDWPVDDQWDIQFNNHYGNLTYENPWGENISGNGTPIRKWHNSNWYMYKILNDSIKSGLKPANDPNDFELIEAFGMSDGTTWVIGGSESGMITNFMRKPEIWHGDPVLEGSFGTNADDTEWTWTNQTFWNELSTPWPNNILSVGNNIGQHFMNTVTHYMSTVSSVVYKVSEGYSMNESIRGLTPGVTVSDLMANLIKPDENQMLKVKAMADGSELAMDALLSNSDTLVVMSADSTNTSKYILEVSEAGLSADAVLSSALYDITIVSQPKSAGDAAEAGSATIEGFEYGTQINTVLANISMPAGASMDIVDKDGAYVSLKTLNFDSTYVFNTVNHNIFFNVTAEDGKTVIVYQLLPEVSQSSAFITSDLYTVNQRDLLVDFIPRGTSVDILLNNIVPSLGASVMLVDKLGLERTMGEISQDDKIVVTSPNGQNTTYYYLSMLASEWTPDVTYLAYILSNSYEVDQVNYVVNGVSGSATIAEFYNRIDVAEGATAVVVDKNGVEKTSGDIDGSDMVKVTSADGKIEVMYTFGTLTSNVTVEGAQIELYPNPTSGRLNVSGLEAGQRIQVFSSTGAAIRDINVQSNIESISLHDQPAGIYMIVVTDENEMIGRYKALKR